MVDIKNGESELNTLALNIEGRSIKCWSEYETTSSYLDPTDTWKFKIAAATEEDRNMYLDIFKGGRQVTASIGNKDQFTGKIDQTAIQYDSNGGTVVSIAGRDILGRFVNSMVSPTLTVVQDSTILSLLENYLRAYDLKKVYNSDSLNLNIITGRPNKDSLTTQTKTVPEQNNVFEADGITPKVNDKGEYIYTYSSKTVTEVVSNKRADLHKITLKELKAHPGEGLYQFFEKILRRLGFVMKAMADGSGIYISSPTFDGEAYGFIINKKSDSSKNNVKSCSYKPDYCSQPSLIMAEGFGGGAEFAKSKFQVILPNEFIAVSKLNSDGTGVYDYDTQRVINKYPKAFVIKPRTELLLNEPLFDLKNSYCPTFLKDDESKSMEELKVFVIRKMAEYQRKAISLSYTVAGLTNQKGEPWAVNTLVNVDDDIHNIHENMWVESRTFNKSIGNGTTTTLKLIKPYTLVLG